MKVDAVNRLAKSPLAVAVALVLAGNAHALPSTNGFSSQTSYLVPTAPGVSVTPILIRVTRSAATPWAVCRTGSVPTTIATTPSRY
jgi:hypothetical protein